MQSLLAFGQALTTPKFYKDPVIAFGVMSKEVKVIDNIHNQRRNASSIKNKLQCILHFFFG